jgi:hypothetical protein
MHAQENVHFAGASWFYGELIVLMETQRGELQFVFVAAGSSLPRIEADMDERLAHGHDRA